MSDDELRMTYCEALVGAIEARKKGPHAAECEIAETDRNLSSGQLKPSRAAFDPTDCQVRPSLAAMVCSERQGLP